MICFHLNLFCFFRRILISLRLRLLSYSLRYPWTSIRVDLWYQPHWTTVPSFTISFLALFSFSLRIGGSLGLPFWTWTRALIRYISSPPTRFLYFHLCFPFTSCLTWGYKPLTVRYRFGNYFRFLYWCLLMMDHLFIDIDLLTKGVRVNVWGGVES